MSDHGWANVIISGASDHEAKRVIDAINAVTARRESNTAAVIVACAQILAQCITQAPHDVAAEVRAGILMLIDDFAMKAAVMEIGK